MTTILIRQAQDRFAYKAMGFDIKDYPNAFHMLAYGLSPPYKA